MKDLIILGAGGFSREASLLVEEINNSRPGKDEWNLLGFIDEDESKWGMELRGYPVLGGWAALAELPAEVSAICVVGEPAAKNKLVDLAGAQGRQFATLIHPQVETAGDIFIGKGVLINKGCLLTVNVRIGDHVLVNPGCGIGHDAIIEPYTNLMWRVNISGAVNVGKGCMIGTGAVVLQGKTIGEWTAVGAGAVVTKDLPPNCTAVGIPAKVISQGKG